MPRHPGVHGINLIGLLPLVIVLAAVVLPMLLSRGKRPPDDPGPESDGGWGRGPWRPEGPTDGPRGGIPLKDAEPARVRLRDHGRLADRFRRRDRRPIRTPDRVKSPNHVS
jgi:hypothetical protein